MKKIVLIVLLFVLSPYLKAQQFFNADNLCFGKMDSVQLYSQWSRARMLDFNKDGKKDFAVINKSQDTLYVFLNNGLANFTVTPAISAYIGSSSYDLCVADFDGDTYTDVVTINSFGDLSVFKNMTGSSLFLVNTLLNTTSNNLEVFRIEAADMNNDSKIDVVGSGKEFALNKLMAFTFENTSALTFGVVKTFNIFIGHDLKNNTPEVPFSVADFDSDGYNDFVVSTDDMTDTLEIYQNSGMAAINFGLPLIYKDPLGGYPEWINTQDLDGDSKPDISVSSFNGFSIIQNQGSFTFGTLYTSFGGTGKRFEIKDINADTNPDLIIVDGAGTFTFFKGTTSLVFPLGSYSSFTVPDSYRFLLEDFDGNAIPDFVFVGTSDSPYLINSRNFSFHLTTSYTSTNTSICPATPVQLFISNSHSYPGLYTWLPSATTGQNHVVTTGGTYSSIFSYTLPPGYGQCNLYSDTLNIQSFPTPTASINSNVAVTICDGTPITLSVTAISSLTTYTWSTGSSSLSISVTPSATSTYSLNLDNGCPGSQTFVVSVIPNPTVNISVPVTTICGGDSVLLTASGAATFTWSPVGPFTSTVSVKPPLTKTYTVVGTSTTGCKDTSLITITVNNAPLLSVIPSKPIICFPDTVTLSVTGATNYTWSTGSNSSFISVLVFTNTNYTITGSNGCTATLVYPLTGLPRPIVNIAISKSSVCYGDSLTLQAFGASTYSWASSVPNFYLGNIIYDYPVSNTTYSVLGQAPNGCYNYSVVSVNVFSVQPVTIPIVELCRGKTSDIMAFGALTYTWNTGFIGQTFSYTPPDLNPITYSVAATDINGCKSTASQDFIVSERCQLVIYNGVTPNGDGHNDYFHIGNIEQYPGNLVLIYNRWGQKLAEIKDYDNFSKRWSGTNQGEGKSVPSGTYYYVINLNNNSDLLKGYIELTKKDFN